MRAEKKENTFIIYDNENRVVYEEEGNERYFYQYCPDGKKYIRQRLIINPDTSQESQERRAFDFTEFNEKGFITHQFKPGFYESWSKHDDHFEVENIKFFSTGAEYIKVFNTNGYLKYSKEIKSVEE